MRWMGIASLLLAALPGMGCTTSIPAVHRTQLQIREFQTRRFDVADTKVVLKAMLNVLQDEGFIIKNADATLGFLMGSKTVDIEPGWLAKLAYVLNDDRYVKTAVIETSVTVTTVGTRTLVRANFEKRVFDNAGVVVAAQQLDDEDYYREFFAKVDKGIFLEKP